MGSLYAKMATYPYDSFWFRNAFHVRIESTQVGITTCTNTDMNTKYGSAPTWARLERIETNDLSSQVDQEHATLFSADSHLFISMMRELCLEDDC